MFLKENIQYNEDFQLVNFSVKLRLEFLAKSFKDLET